MSLLDRGTLVEEGPTVNMNDLYKIMEPYKDKTTLTPGEASKLNFSIIELLMENKTDRQVLKFVSRFLSVSVYEELITERTINHFCGYPLCSYYNAKKIKDVEISHLVTKLKLPRSYNTRFCSRLHYQCSEFYKKQLSAEALWGRSNVMQQAHKGGAKKGYDNLMDSNTIDHHSHGTTEIILLDEVLETESREEDHSSTIQDVIKLLTEMSVADPELETDEVIEKFNSIQIRENVGYQKSDQVYN